MADSLKEMLAAGGATGDASGQLSTDLSRVGSTGSTSGRGPARSGSRRKQRQLLLLTSLEEMSVEQAAPIVDSVSIAPRRSLPTRASVCERSAATDVLIIEDEPIIAMDIEELVQGCGHRVVGVAATERDAVDSRAALALGLSWRTSISVPAATARRPCRASCRAIRAGDLRDRLSRAAADRRELEPAFVITKPFEPITLAIATYQAVTGGVHLD